MALNLIAGMEAANVGVINSYNDLLSAHHPLALYPDQIKQFARPLRLLMHLALNMLGVDHEEARIETAAAVGRRNGAGDEVQDIQSWVDIVL